MDSVIPPIIYHFHFSAGGVSPATSLCVPEEASSSSIASLSRRNTQFARINITPESCFKETELF